MKNIKYILFTILFLFFNVFNVDASCTEEEIASLKGEASNIKVTYKHLGKIEREEGDFYNLFEVKVNNINDDFYILTLDNTIKLIPTNRGIVTTLNSGAWYFDIYSNKCGEKIKTIKVFIPTFNMYSLDPLCEGINGDDFALCGKYYEYDVEYEEFVARVNYYRNTHIVKEEESYSENNVSVLGSILQFVLNYRKYILIFLTMLLIIILAIGRIKKKGKRGVLE